MAPTAVYLEKAYLWLSKRSELISLKKGGEMDDSGTETISQKGTIAIDGLSLLVIFRG